MNVAEDSSKSCEVDCVEKIDRRKSLMKAASLRGNMLRRPTFRKQKSEANVMAPKSVENDTEEAIKKIPKRGLTKKPSLRGLGLGKGSDDEHKNWEWKTLKRTNSIGAFETTEEEPASAWVPRAPHPLLVNESDDEQEVSPEEDGIAI
eukprot:15331969-Ditylum_brightwellii.AAC.2